MHIDVVFPQRIMLKSCHMLPKRMLRFRWMGTRRSGPTRRVATCCTVFCEPRTCGGTVLPTRYRKCCFVVLASVIGGALSGCAAGVCRRLIPRGSESFSRLRPIPRSSLVWDLGASGQNRSFRRRRCRPCVRTWSHKAWTPACLVGRARLGCPAVRRPARAPCTSDRCAPPTAIVTGPAPPPIAPPQPFIAPSLLNQTYPNVRGTSGIQGRLSINPLRLVAPVGSEIVLQASICGEDGYLVTGETIEWSLSPNSGGSIVQVDDSERPFWRRLWHRPPIKKSGQYALGRTSTARQLLTRGTPDPSDDVYLREGQTWVSLTSAIEGVSQITAVAPGLAGWEQRRQTATVYWVDGQWTLPGPALGGGSSSQVLCTQVRRATSSDPIPGWLVRYEVAGGTPASLDDLGSQVQEVVTDVSGNACVNVTVQGPATGATQLKIQIVRVSLAGGDLPRLVVGEGATSVTWGPAPVPDLPYQPPTSPPPGPFEPPAASQPPSLPAGPVPPPGPVTPPAPTVPRVGVLGTGPTTAEIGGPGTYEFRVSNNDALTAEAVDVAIKVPPGVQVVATIPEAEEFGDTLKWQLGPLQPRQSRSIRTTLTSETPAVSACALRPRRGEASRRRIASRPTSAGICSGCGWTVRYEAWWEKNSAMSSRSPIAVRRCSRTFF